MNYAAMRYVAETCTIQGAGRALLWAIAYRADRRSGECWTALRRLANEAGIDYATAKRVKQQLLDQDELEIVLHGAGRRPTCLRIIGSGLAVRPQDEFVVGASEGRSGRIGEPVVGASGASSIRQEGKNEEGLEGRAGVAAPDGAAPRLEEPADAFGRDWRSALNGQRPATAPTSSESEPNPRSECDPADVPDHAPTEFEPPHQDVAREPTRRKQRRGRRSREPPTTCTRSHPSRRTAYDRCRVA